MKTEEGKPAPENPANFDHGQMESALSARSGGSDQMLSPSHAGRDSLFLQSNLKELKDNYHQIEHQIQSETNKQRDTQRERYSLVLDQISTLKKLLKVEVEQRKNAETVFRDQI